jgi:hypothetical protein
MPVAMAMSMAMPTVVIPVPAPIAVPVVMAVPAGLLPIGGWSGSNINDFTHFVARIGVVPGVTWMVRTHVYPSVGPGNSANDGSNHCTITATNGIANERSCPSTHHAAKDGIMGLGLCHGAQTTQTQRQNHCSGGMRGMLFKA